MDIYNPRQAILLTTRADIEILGRKITKDNICTLTWHMPVSSEPGLYAISLGDRFSHRLIKESGVFCVNFISSQLKDQAVFCGTHSGEHMDKFKEMKLTREECSKIDCSAIKESLAYLECEVVNEVETGDHCIIIGKILNIMEHKKGKRLFQGAKKAGKRTFTTTLS